MEKNHGVIYKGHFLGILRNNEKKHATWYCRVSGSEILPSQYKQGDPFMNVLH